MKIREKNKQQKGSMYIFNISFSQDFDFKKNRFRRWKKSEKIYNWSQWASIEIKKMMAKEWYRGLLENPHLQVKVLWFFAFRPVFIMAGFSFIKQKFDNHCLE